MAAIVARDLSVEFRIYGGSRARSLKSLVINAATGGRLARQANEGIAVRALNKLDFEFRAGERIGLMGHNGSGKTTLLRTIAGAYEPTGGTLTVDGRVASMLSIWLGLDHEATGYENIQLRARLLGFRRSEMAQLADEVCDFADLGDFIHLPLRTYSSGMAMRLAFAISTSVDSDILLMDEWLSVGDPEFAEKAQARLQKLIERAKILVVSSHSEEMLRRNCTRLIRLSHGEIVGTEDLRPIDQIPSVENRGCGEAG